jgi:hypothetical protein
MLRNDSIELLLDVFVGFVFEILLEILFVLSVQNEMMKLIFFDKLRCVVERVG